MCMVSMVHEEFDPVIPGVTPWPNWDPAVPPRVAPNPLLDVTKTIADLKEALALAARLDELLKQKDCVDPEKAKLMERVERLLAATAAGETVKIEKTTTLEAGVYRIIDGKLYKVIE